MTCDIEVHAFYAEKATAASYRVGDSISNMGQLRACLQRSVGLKFEKEWLQPPEIHLDPNSVLLATSKFSSVSMNIHSCYLQTCMVPPC
jgi:hypothetical protein